MGIFRLEYEMVTQCGISKERFHKVSGNQWENIYQKIVEKLRFSQPSNVPFIIVSTWLGMWDGILVSLFPSFTTFRLEQPQNVLLK